MLLRYAYSVIFCEKTVVLISGVSKTRRRARGLSFFKKNAILGLRLGSALALTLTLKQHFFKKNKIDPDPAFY